jgi:hypothetical protein
MGIEVGHGLERQLSATQHKPTPGPTGGRSSSARKRLVGRLHRRPSDAGPSAGGPSGTLTGHQSERLIGCPDPMADRALSGMNGAAELWAIGTLRFIA